MVQGLKALLLGQAEEYPRRSLRGYVDSLIQTFENCRSGLSNETIEGGESASADFFFDLYNKELGRLSKAIEMNEAYLSDETRKQFFHEVCEVLTKVVIPAYVRLAVSFTHRERNDFYLLPHKLHFLERIFWAIGGMILGAFVVWAPFIPIWSKEWVLPFAISGLIFPDLRRFFSMKRYESELNRMVARADLEIDRIEMAYLTEKISPEIQPAEDESQKPEQERLNQQKTNQSIKN